MAESSREEGKGRLVSLGPLASDDQVAIFNYTARRWSFTQAEEYLGYMGAIMQQLADQPSMGPVVNHPYDIRVYVVRWRGARQGHRIFYNETDDGIYVFRILHTSMNWSDHLAFE